MNGLAQPSAGDPWGLGGFASLAPIVKQDLSKVLFGPTPDDPIVKHADYYARNNGWHVFPVPPGTKKSHKSAEHSDGRPWGATVDADEIGRDFNQWPDANVGIVTGAISGIFIVETDTADGHGDGTDGAAELAMLEAEHGPLPKTLEAESPSGSIHRYYKHPGFQIKNSASLIGPGIDVRGDGGMVVAPPSIKPGMGVYVWRNQLLIADAPQWLLDRIVAGKAKPEATLSISQQAAAMVRPRDGFDVFAEGASRRVGGSGYVEAALRGEYDEVAQAPEGRRNHQLNTSSLKLGHYVGSGVLDEKKVIDAMMEACDHNGSLKADGRSACLATISSGLEAGKRDPKGVPEPKYLPDQTSDPIPIDSVISPKPAPGGMPLTFFDNVENFAKKNWLMKGVIAKRETSMWIAPPGRLKSALMTDLAIHLASGMDWRGYQLKETCGVVYFALERADLVKRRLAAHRRRDGLTGLPIAVAGGVINLMDPKCVDIIVKTIRDAEIQFACSAGFAVFDTFAKGIAAGGGDENHAKDLGAALANLRRVQDRTGAHIAVVSHTGKDEKKGARGSNSQDGDVDVLVQINGDGTIKIAMVTKANDQAEGELTKFKAEIAVLGFDEDGDEITTAIVSTDLCGSEDGKSNEKMPLKPTERRAMGLLYNAINDAGVHPPPSPEFPQKLKVVPIDTWRNYCERGGLSEGKTKDAFRMAFRRLTISLANKGRIGMLDGWVWVAYD